MNAVGVLDRGFVTAAEPVMEQNMSLHSVHSAFTPNSLSVCEKMTIVVSWSFHWVDLMVFPVEVLLYLSHNMPFEIYNLELYACMHGPTYCSLVYHYSPPSLLCAWNCVLCYILLYRYCHKSYLFWVVSDLVLINVSMVKQYKGGEQAFVVEE